ncbi:MAG: hypothetical protein AAB766_01065 [Patescibacteria group bacterium]
MDVTVIKPIRIDVSGKTAEQVEAEVVRHLFELGHTNEDGNVVMGSYKAYQGTGTDGSACVMFMLEKANFAFVGADEQWFKDFEKQFNREPLNKVELTVVSKELALTYVKSMRSWVAKLGDEYGVNFNSEFQSALVRIEEIKRMPASTLFLSTIVAGFEHELHDKLTALVNISDLRFFPMPHALGEFYLQRGRSLEAQFNAKAFVKDVAKLWDEIIRCYEYSLKNLQLGLSNCLEQRSKNSELAEAFTVCNLQQISTVILSCVGRLASAIVCKKLLDKQVEVTEWPDQPRLVQVLAEDKEIDQDKKLSSLLEYGVSIGEIAIKTPFLVDEAMICCMQNYGILLIYCRRFDSAKEIFEFILKQNPGLEETLHALDVIRKLESEDKLN